MADAGAIGRVLALVAGLTVALLALGWTAGAGLIASPQRAPAWLVSTPIAHRGLHTNDATRPENSLAAFGAAAEQGHPIEFDVHLSADGVVMVFHDAVLERMTGDPRQIGEATAAELGALSLLGTNERIPSLAEVLSLVEGRVPVLIEIKQRDEVGPLEEAVVDVVTGYGGEIAVQSFNPYSLARIREIAPGLPRGQLSGTFAGEDLPRWQLFALKNLLMNWTSRPAFIAYELDGLPSMSASLQRMRGRPLIGWTASDPQAYASSQELCDGVIFDPGAF